MYLVCWYKNYRAVCQWKQWMNQCCHRMFVEKNNKWHIQLWHDYMQHSISRPPKLVSHQPTPPWQQGIPLHVQTLGSGSASRSQWDGGPPQPNLWKWQHNLQWIQIPAQLNIYHHTTTLPCALIIYIKKEGIDLTGGSWMGPFAYQLWTGPAQYPPIPLWWYQSLHWCHCTPRIIHHYHSPMLNHQASIPPRKPTKMPQGDLSGVHWPIPLKYNFWTGSVPHLPTLSQRRQFLY